MVEYAVICVLRTILERLFKKLNILSFKLKDSVKTHLNAYV